MAEWSGTPGGARRPSWLYGPARAGGARAPRSRRRRGRVLFLQFRRSAPLGLLTPNLLSRRSWRPSADRTTRLPGWRRCTVMTTIFPGASCTCPPPPRSSCTVDSARGCRRSATECTADRWLRVRAVDNIHPCAAGAARYAAAVLADTQLIFGLPVGSTHGRRANGPKTPSTLATRLVPDDHPPRASPRRRSPRTASDSFGR